LDRAKVVVVVQTNVDGKRSALNRQAGDLAVVRCSICTRPATVNRCGGGVGAK
jgi:hypothetical protein